MIKNSLYNKKSVEKYAGQFVPAHLRKRGDGNRQAGRHGIISLDCEHNNRSNSLMKINDSFEFYDYE